MPENPEDRDKDMPENSENAERPPPEETGGKKRRFTLKKVLMIAIALVVVGSLVQVVAKSGGFGGALSTTGGKPRTENEKSEPKEIKEPAQKPKTVELGGQKIPGQSGPIIVLNPGLVTPGGKATVEGSGFDAGATVDLLLKTSAQQSRAKGIAEVKIGKSGSLNTQIAVPENVGKGAVLVAQQRGGDKVAEAPFVSGGAVGSVKVSKGVGKPGDSVSLSARGFGAGERINVFWGRVGGKPDATLTADDSGGVGRAAVRVGVAPTGSGTLILVGEKSKTTATAPFYMLRLYPSLTSAPYALKAGERITVSAAGFAPAERVLFYINRAAGVPAFTTTSDAKGNVGSVAFEVPFGLKGKQSVTAVGERTQASVRAGFQVMPYTPTAEPSTYAGKAGTTVSFFVNGFAANETVTLYAGGPSGGAKKIATFRVDAKGAAKGLGSYRITEADEGGVAFKLVGGKSGGEAETAVNATQRGQGQDQGQGQ